MGPGREIANGSLRTIPILSYSIWKAVLKGSNINQVFA